MEMEVKLWKSILISLQHSYLRNFILVVAQKSWSWILSWFESWYSLALAPSGIFIHTGKYCSQFDNDRVTLFLQPEPMSNINN